MNAKLAALLSTALFAVSALATITVLAPVASADVPSGYTCPLPDSNEEDKLFLALCQVAVAAGAGANGDFLRTTSTGAENSGDIVDRDDDGRPDAYYFAIRQAASPPQPAVSQRIVVPLDLFVDDDNPSTPDAPYDLMASPGAFDVPLDPQFILALPFAGSLSNAGNETRISNMFVREGLDTYPTNYTNQKFDLAIYTPDNSKDRKLDGSYPGFCVLCVNRTKNLILFGTGGQSDSLLDIDPQGENSIRERIPNHRNNVTAGSLGNLSFMKNSRPTSQDLLLYAGVSLNIAGNTAFMSPDGQGLRFNVVHVKVNVTSSDIDDDGYTDVEEIQCAIGPWFSPSNPTYPYSTCDDVDADGRFNHEEDIDHDAILDLPPADEVAFDPRTESLPYVRETDGDGTLDGLDTHPQDIFKGGAPPPDTDGDGVADATDNCINTDNGPTQFAPDPDGNQTDLDGDGVGNACDSDKDGDSVPNTQDMTNYTADNGGDMDLDGLNATYERAGPFKVVNGAITGRYGATSPVDSDSDDDGLSDSNETATTLNATSKVGDANTAGVTSGTPFAGNSTNPNALSSDSDELTDKEEVTGSKNTAYGSKATDPNDADTDNDGLSDSEEALAKYNWAQRPTVPTSTPAGPGPVTSQPNPLVDSNGRTIVGGIRVVHPPATDPNDADTDNDGYSDGREIFPSCTRWSEVPAGGPAPIPGTPASHQVYCVRDGKYFLQTDPTDSKDPLQFASSPDATAFLPKGYSSDANDPRDIDHDGNFSEPSGQPDLLEQFVFYFDADSDDVGTKNANGFETKGGNGVTLYLVQSFPPTISGKPKPVLTVRLGDVAATPNVAELVVVQDGPTGSADTWTYCIIEVDGGSRQLYAGNQSFNQEGAAHPCGRPATVWNESNFPLPFAGLYCSETQPTGGINGYLEALDPGLCFGMYDEGDAPANPWLQFIDADGDNVPEGIQLNLIDPATCDDSLFCQPMDEQIVMFDQLDGALTTLTDMLPQVQQPPAVFTAEAGGPYAGEATSKIAILATSTNAAAGAAPTCIWSSISAGATFDSTTSCATNVTFAASGTKTISVTMKDANNNEDDDIATVTVAAAPPLNVSAGGPYSGANDTKIAIAASVTGASGFTCRWTNKTGESGAVFDDANACSTNVTYVGSESAGLHNITVNVTEVGGTGRQAEANANVTITAPQALAADATGPTTALVGDNKTFTATLTGGAGGNACTWTTTAGANATISSNRSCSGTGITFLLNGTFTVTLTVTDSASGSSTDTVTVTVSNKNLTANAGADQSGTSGSPINLAGSATNATKGYSCSWSGSTGSPSFGNANLCNTTVTYAEAGTYTVTLTVTDGVGRTQTDSATMTVAEPDCFPGETGFPDCMVGEPGENFDPCSETDTSDPMYVCYMPEAETLLGQGIIINVLGLVIFI